MTMSLVLAATSTKTMT